MLYWLHVLPIYISLPGVVIFVSSASSSSPVQVRQRAANASDRSIPVGSVGSYTEGLSAWKHSNWEHHNNGEK